VDKLAATGQPRHHGHHDDTDRHVTPSTGTERYLAALWEELLGVDRVGATDDFFALGGHSLQAFRARHRIRRDLGVNISHADLLRTTVLCDLAQELDDMQSDLEL
jgi:hypothetical protein